MYKTETKQKKIYLASPHMSDEGYEQQFVQEAFNTNWISSVGRNVDQFELELNQKVDIPYSAALSSGTAAIHLALKLANIGAGDIVFCQSLTFAATANPILYEKATPVFIDSDLESWNMCPKALEKALIKYPNTKAVILVHLYGLSAKLDEIVSLCKQYNVVLIEDAAESLGTTYKNKHTGTFGRYGIYSFNGNKIITTSGGGMLVSHDGDAIEKAKFWATQARDQALHYQHSEIGYNYRLSNICAGIGRGQLMVLDERIAKKRYIYAFYKRELSNIADISFMPENEWNEPNFWLSCIVLKGKVGALDIIQALAKENIESRPIWKPMHLQPIFSQYDYIGETVAEDLFTSGVCLPSDTKMTDEDLQRVIQIIRGLWV